MGEQDVRRVDKDLELALMNAIRFLSCEVQG
jgi:hypothetical protein